jgi:hypothetical protein
MLIGVEKVLDPGSGSATLTAIIGTGRFIFEKSTGIVKLDHLCFASLEVDNRAHFF